MNLPDHTVSSFETGSGQRQKREGCDAKKAAAFLARCFLRRGTNLKIFRRSSINSAASARIERDRRQMWPVERLERFPIGWNHPVDEKSLQIQNLEHIPLDQIGSIRSEFALASSGLGLRDVAPELGRAE